MPSVEEVIESLQANARILRQVGDLLEGCIPGLLVDKVDVFVSEVKERSLSEIFAAALFLTYQKELEAEVPALFEKITGVHVDSSYDTIVTVVAMLLVFYSIDFAYRPMNDALSSRKLKQQLDGLVSDTSRLLNVPEDRIRKTLASRYSGRRLRKLAATAVGFFKPSKNHANAPILVGSMRIDQETVAEAPRFVTETRLKGETSRFVGNTKIHLIALDLDRHKRGWAAVIPQISSKRVDLHIYPPVTTDQIFHERTIVGDVIAIMVRNEDDTLEPVRKLSC